MKQFKCTAAVFLDTLHYRSHMIVNVSLMLLQFLNIGLL